MTVIEKQMDFAPTNELVAAVLGNCCKTDKAFAEQLKKDPLETLKVMNGVHDLPIQDVSVHAVQNTENVVHIPLPVYSQMPEVEKYLQEQLTDEQLEGIAGGEIVASIVMGLATVGFVLGTIGTALGVAAGGAAIAVGLALVVGVTVLAAGAVAGGGVAIAAGAGAI